MGPIESIAFAFFLCEQQAPKASVDGFSPDTFSAHKPLTSELLRFLLRVAASKPTSWLSMGFYILSHLAIILGP